MGDALFVGGGVTSPKEARLASAGLLALQGTGAFDVRTGVLTGPGSTQLVTGTADTGPMTVAIAPHVPVTSRGVANGPYIGPVPEAVTKVPIPAAPGANARIDVVYEVQQDATTDVAPDGTTAPVWGVLQGAVSAVPVKPDLSTIPGALELATVRVAAGATSSNGAGVTITNTARQTVARGARIPVATEAERNALFAFPGLEVYRLDTGQVQLCTSATAAGAGTWVTTYNPAAPVTLRNTGRQGNNVLGGGAQAYGSASAGRLVIPAGTQQRQVRIDCDVDVWCPSASPSAGAMRLYANSTDLLPDPAGWGTFHNLVATGTYAARPATMHVRWEGLLPASVQNIWLNITSDPGTGAFWVTGFDLTVVYS